MNLNAVKLFGGLLMIATGGGLVGFVIGQKVTEKRLREAHEKEIEDLKKHYNKRTKSGQYANLADLAKQYREEMQAGLEISEKIAKDQGYVEDPDQNGSDEEPQFEVDPNYERDMQIPSEQWWGDNDGPSEPIKVKKHKDRDTSKPYVISHEEYFEERHDFEKAQLSYYVGDDILADDRDQIIPDQYMAVGDDALDCFGQESLDNNVVYVRNERISVDFEVTRYDSTYQVDVLGLTEPRVLKVRKMKKEE